MKDVDFKPKIDPSEQHRAMAEKTVELIASLPMWPEYAKIWARDTAKKTDGMKTLASTIIEDSQNHQGWRDVDRTTKDKALEMCLNELGFADKAKEALTKIENQKFQDSSAKQEYFCFVAERKAA